MPELIIALVALVGIVIALPVMFRISVRPEIGIYLFLFLSSITIAPDFPVVGDRLAVADFVMGFTILAAWLRRRQRRLEPRLRRVERYADMLILFCTVSSLLGIAFGVDPMRAALFMVIYLYGYLSFKTIVRHVNTPEKVKNACLAWGVGAALVILVGFLASTGIYKPAWTYDAIIGRISSTMKDSGQVSSYMAPALLMYIFMVTNREIRPLYRLGALGLCAMGVVVLLGTGSRISFVMLLFFLAYAVFLTLRRWRHRISRTPLLLFLAGTFIAGGSYVVSVWTDTSERYGLLTTSPFERAIKIFSEQTRTMDSTSGSVLEDIGGTRYEEIMAALKHFPEHPIFGVGSGLFGITYRMNEVHNSAFSLLIENGVLAFLLYWLWWGAIVSLLLRCRRAAWSSKLKFIYTLALGMVAVFLIYQMTTNGLRQRPFWFVPALALCSYRLLRLEEQHRPRFVSAGTTSPGFPVWSPPPSR